MPLQTKNLFLLNSKRPNHQLFLLDDQYRLQKKKNYFSSQIKIDCKKKKGGSLNKKAVIILKSTVKVHFRFW